MSSAPTRARLHAAVLAATTLVATTSAGASDTGFVVVGDTPYGEEERRTMEGDVRPAIAASGAPFVVHVGDFKSGSGPCPRTVAEVRAVRGWIDQLHDGPVIYTPGDNDWTDCDRGAGSSAISELDALGRLRAVFFDEPPPLDDASAGRWGFERQAGFPENARWVHDGVLFATLHVVGTNNGRAEILLDDREVALRRVETRDHADTQWLVAAFERAREREVRALVVLTQADVTAPGGGGPCTATNREHCDAFLALREQLATFASRLRNDHRSALKPVLLVHGDTHPYCMDRGFGGERAPNLWRLNAWGDFKRPADATLVSFRPDDAAEPFAARTLVGGVPPDDGC